MNPYELSPQDQVVIDKARRYPTKGYAFKNPYERNIATKLALQGVLYTDGTDYAGDYMYKTTRAYEELRAAYNPSPCTNDEALLDLIEQMGHFQDTTINNPMQFAAIDALIEHGYAEVVDADRFGNKVVRTTHAGIEWYMAHRPAPIEEEKIEETALEEPAPIEAILAERQTTYGEYRDVARTAQNLKNVLRAVGDNYPSKPYQLESLDMICNKLARIVNGDPNYVDSWDDIAGYATLVSKELNRSKK